MKLAHLLAAAVCAGFFVAAPSAASHLVTGNGFGFAVVSPEKGTVNRFYAHPYSFERPDPKNPLSEGIETANFLKEIGWRKRGGLGSSEQGSSGLGSPRQGASTDYEQDSQVIHVRRND